jgi:hypothetical protein
LASGCRAARRRCGGNLPVGSWLPGCPRAAGWPGLVRPSMGPEAPPGAGPVRYVARWFALFRPSPLKTGPSQCTDHPQSKRRFFKVFCTLSHHIHHFAPKWGRRVCVEVKLLTSIASIAPLILYEYFCCDVCISSLPDRAPHRRWVLRGFKSQSTAGGAHLPQWHLV